MSCYLSDLIVYNEITCCFLRTCYYSSLYFSNFFEGNDFACDTNIVNEDNIGPKTEK